MRLGVSGWRLSGQPLGVSRYIEYLLLHWQQMIQAPDDATVFVCEPLSPERARRIGGIDVEMIQPQLTNALWENLLLPRRARGLDVLFCPSYTAPLTYRGRIVLAIHSADEAGKRIPSLRALPFELKYKWSAHKAERIVVNAQTVKDGIVSQYGVDPAKVDVVHLAADEAFRPLHDEGLKSATRCKLLGTDRPYILFVGGMSQRRNVPMLLEAFSILKRTTGIPHALLLVGPNRANLPLAELVGKLGIADSVVHTVGKFASHDELVAIYNAADVYVMPSWSEGFSLTLIEAMRCGTPVITVNRTALGEVAHGHALTMDEPSVAGLVDALGRILGDEALRRTVSARCLARAQDFTWEKTARRTLEIIRQVAAG